MKILHVDTEKGFRGGEQQLLWLAEGLKKQGITTAVACRKSDTLERLCKKYNIKTYPLTGCQFTDTIILSNIGRSYDIVHSHSAKAHTITALSKVFNRKPLIYTRRIDYSPRKNIPTVLKYKHTDLIVAVSKCVAKVLETSLNIDKKKIVTIHSSTSLDLINFVDNKKVDKIRNQINGLPIIGTAAALTEQKNIPNLIEAARILTSKLPKATFVVVGEGKLKNKLIKQVVKAGLQEKFLFLGFKKDIQNYIKAFDIFVLPSNNEGFSGSLLNAMLLKVPVIATNSGGSKEVIKNFQTGLLIPKKNPEAIVRSVLMLTKDTQLKEYITNNAYKSISENFSVEKMVEKYIIVYEKILGGKQ